MRHEVTFSLFCIFIIQSAIFKTDSLESVSLTCRSVKFNRDKIFRFYLQEVKIPSCPSEAATRGSDPVIACPYSRLQPPKSRYFFKIDGEFLKIVTASLK